MLPYKVAIAIGGVGAATGGGILLTKSLRSKDKPTISKTSIRERLQKVGYSLNVSDDHWNSIFEEYKKTNYSASIKFPSENINISTLKDKCSEYLNENDVNNSKYEITKRWCVEPRNISAFLTAFQLTPLNTGDESAKDSWVKLEEEYRKNKKEGISNFTLTATKSDDTWKELKEKCKSLLDLNPWGDDYEMAMNRTKLWCTQEGVPK